MFVSDGCQLYPSPDCSLVVLVIQNQHFFLWQKELGATDAKSNVLLGKWSRIYPPSKISLPSLQAVEVNMDAVFSNSEEVRLCIIIKQCLSKSICTIFKLFKSQHCNFIFSF